MNESENRKTNEQLIIEARLEEVEAMPHPGHCSSYVTYGLTVTDLGVRNSLQFNCDCYKSVRLAELRAQLAELTKLEGDVDPPQNPAVESRSVQKRKALQRGEPWPKGENQ